MAETQQVELVYVARSGNFRVVKASWTDRADVVYTLEVAQGKDSLNTPRWFPVDGLIDMATLMQGVGEITEELLSLRKFKSDKEGKEHI
jgi:hypothetical protein